MADPMDALRLPATPVAPDPAFAAALRDRMIDVLLAPRSKEIPMSTTDSTADAVPRNGLRHGDVSYLTFRVPDASTARAFYGPLLGWSFEPGDPAPRSSVTGVRPEMGLSAAAAATDENLGVTLAYRVDDIAAAVAQIRSAGGTATDPVQRPYALEAECADPGGIPFYLHQFEDGPTQTADLRNGAHEGDVAYISLGVRDLAEAQAFYGAVLGWTFGPGNLEQGRQVESVLPMIGLWGGGGWTGVRLAYRVDDIRAAVARVADLGGTAGPVQERPYGLSCDDCRDNQGLGFMLLQLADTG